MDAKVQTLDKPEVQAVGSQSEFLLRQVPRAEEREHGVAREQGHPLSAPLVVASRPCCTFNRMFELYPEQRAEGQILLDGQDILTTKEDVSLIRAKVGMVFQKPTPFPMSIYENIAFGVRLFENLSRVEMDERVEWALKKAALWNEVKTS